MLRKIILIFVKLGWLKRPKQHQYAVEALVELKGTVIKRFPLTTMAYTRKWARRISKHRVRVDTGTTAIRSEKDRRKFIVPLKIYVDDILSHESMVEVEAKGRRDAKFEVTKRLELKFGNCARVDHLKKYNKKAN
jgi:hypothetical protein